MLLSKDIEAKLALLDREVTYLLNKAKFAKPKPKPKPKDKNSTSSENGKTNNTDSEKVIPPNDESSKREKKPGCFKILTLGFSIVVSTYFEFGASWKIFDVPDGAEEAKPAEEPPTEENKKEETETEPTIAEKTEDKGNLLDMQTWSVLK